MVGREKVYCLICREKVYYLYERQGKGVLPLMIGWEKVYCL